MWWWGEDCNDGEDVDRDDDGGGDDGNDGGGVGGQVRPSHSRGNCALSQEPLLCQTGVNLTAHCAAQSNTPQSRAKLNTEVQ